MATVGTVVLLVCQLMFYTGLFGIFFTARAVSPGRWPPGPVTLDIAYASGLTVLVLASSVTCQLGMFAGVRPDSSAARRWILISLLLAVAFIVGQLNQFRLLVDEGLTITSSAFASVFYLTTVFHLINLLAAVVVVGRFLTSTQSGWSAGTHTVRAIVLSYCWHFTTVAWIALFTAIYLIR